MSQAVTASAELRPHVGAAIRIGTRGSALALAQANLVAQAVRGAGAPIEIVTVETHGDRRAPDTPWGEGAFVAAIQRALLDGRVDVAVHSAKDVPTDPVDGLVIGAYLPREDPRDCLVLPSGARAASLADLPRQRPESAPIRPAGAASSGRRVGISAPSRCTGTSTRGCAARRGQRRRAGPCRRRAHATRSRTTHLFPAGPDGRATGAGPGRDLGRGTRRRRRHARVAGRARSPADASRGRSRTRGAAVRRRWLPVADRRARHDRWRAAAPRRGLRVDRTARPPR